MNFSVKRLDHLGVIAGIMQELNLIKMVDTLLQADKQNILTPEEVVQAMIINGLRFSSKPTTLTPQFFATKQTDELIRSDISSEQLNRFKLGRVLDGNYENQDEDASVQITYGYSKAKRPDFFVTRGF